MGSIKLGLCIPKTKRSRTRLPERIQELCDSSDIEIINIDIDKNLHLQGPFDVLLHKVVDYYKEYELDEANQKINKLISYASEHEEMVVIDDFSWCLKLTNRKSMIELFKLCEFNVNGIKVSSPKTIDISENMTVTEIRDNIRRTKIKYPVLVKSYLACLDKDSHSMSLIFTEDDLENIRLPCLIQEYCNHGGVYYKVFVVGLKFSICENPSLKDFLVMSDVTKNDNSTIYFNTREIAKIGKPFDARLHETDPNSRIWKTCDESPNMLNRSVIEEIITRIQQITGCHLLKFDILIEKGSGNYLLIDMNQFPSYDGINERHFPEHLVELIKVLVPRC